MAQEAPGVRLSSTLFKYAGPGIQSRMLAGPKAAAFKCSHPKDFNDPYELFLSIDRNEEPERLAFYADVIGDIPQRATTCFSRSPSVVPMWAHYADNGRGFVVEVDEAVLVEAGPESGFGDVDYRDAPDPELNVLLGQAFTTCKPRHTYMLRNAVMSAAYYTKAKCWSYEQERRMVVHEDNIRSEAGLFLLDVPKEAIVRLIAGPSISDDARASLKAYAQSLDCAFTQLQIGRTACAPYFLDDDGEATLFDGLTFVAADNRCADCGDPIGDGDTACSLCRISEAHRAVAAHSNPYRLLHHAGLLADYVRDMNVITKSRPKRS